MEGKVVTEREDSGNKTLKIYNTILYFYENQHYRYKYITITRSRSGGILTGGQKRGILLRAGQNKSQVHFYIL